MRRQVLCLLAVVFSGSVLLAQEMPRAESALQTQILPLPLALVLEETKYAGGNAGTWVATVWRPDWPLELPPDAFKVKSGEVSRLTIGGAGFSLEFSFDETGRVKTFPFMLGGRMVQVTLSYQEEKIREMALAFPARAAVQGETAGEDAFFESAVFAGSDVPDDPWKFEFLEYQDSFPVLVRGSRGDAWYFIVLARGGNEISETWYDEKGNFLGGYSSSLIKIGEVRRIRSLRPFGQGFEKPDLGTLGLSGNIRDFPASDKGTAERYYDSRGFLTGIAGPGGLFGVLYYREDLPRYWERLPRTGMAGGTKDREGAGNFSLQWDEEGSLVRISYRTASPGTFESPVEYRYDYTLDERGNWIERREIRMIRRLGLLVPLPGITFTRVLEYR